MNLSTRAGVREVIEKYGLAAKKKLGQHFLVDGHVVEKILKAADVNENDVVLEIGPGIGGLTQALAGRAKHVVAVELDKQLIPVLENEFAGSNVTIVHNDILRADLNEILSPYMNLTSSHESAVKIVANLPYYITTPVILYLLESGIPIKSITVMVQKEVARRMAACPGTKDYGSLTLAVQYYANVTIAAYVPVNCFMPRPAVDSAVAHLQILASPTVDADKEILFKIIHAAFNHRRKTLVNTLDAAGFGAGKNDLAKTLESRGLNPQVRGEALSIFQFAELAKVLAL
jgi:16S rRNA (adenine1518-N6/adenine1519-N6)-dimethyltransferase